MEVSQEGRLNGGHALSGAADPEDLSFDKKMDVATPILFHCCAVGAVIPRGRVIQCNDVGAVYNNNNGRLPVADYAFGDSIITNITSSASGGGLADDSFSINYGSIMWRYHYYNNYKIGRPGHEAEKVQREWSVISSNTSKADSNTRAIEEAIDCNCPGAYTKIVNGIATIQNASEQDDIDEMHSKVNFKAGTVVDVTPPSSRIYEDKNLSVD